MNATVLSKSVELFQLYYTPVLVYLGVIGNSLCVYVFRSPKLRILSSSYYLSALAISDTVFLLALFTVWLTMVGIDVFNQPGACQIIVFLTGVSSFLSVWFVVAFTVERFIAVRYPLLRHSLCTVQRAKMVIIGLTILSLILYMPLLLFAGARKLPEFPMLCTVLPLWQDEAAAFNIVDTFLTFFIPVITIVKLNICISKAVWNFHNIRNRLIQKKPRAKGKPRDSQMMFSPARQKFERRNNSQKKVTKMLLVVSTIFLCLNLPSYIMRVLTYLIEFQMLQEVDIGIFTTIQHCCLQIFNTNFGINFVLYCIGGVNFRKAVVTRICGHQLRYQRNHTTPLMKTESGIFSSKSCPTSRMIRQPKKTENQEMVYLTHVIEKSTINNM